MSRNRFSTAAKLADTFVTSRLTSVFILACVIVGTIALIMTPRTDNPRIVVPAANIKVTLPGATSSEVESLIIRPIETAIKQIPGVDNVYATAMNSIGIVSVQFKVDQDPDKVLVRLYDRIGSHREIFPPDAGQPIIQGINVDDVPIVTLTLASSQYDDYALKRLADHFADGLRVLNDVSSISVEGGRDRELRIELNPDRMNVYGVTPSQVRAQIIAANVAGPIGNMMRQGKNSNIYLKGFVKSVAEIRRLVVGKNDGRPIVLGDVAKVIDGPIEERSKLSRFAFGPADKRFDQSKNTEMPAVTVAIAKKTGTNAVFVANDILARIDKMKNKFLPENVNLVVTRNDGSIANATVNRLIEHLLISVMAVFIVVLLFLGSKEALIVGLAVPLVLALTLGIGYFFDQSINRVSLFALILSLGLLVDDAIVVIENIHRNYSLGLHSKREATVLAALEIGNPTNLATLAVMLVFGSLIMVTGTPGEYFTPIAFTVPVAMASSLFVAYTVVPWAAHRWLPEGNAHSRKKDNHEGNIESILHRVYRRFLTSILNNSINRRLLMLSVIVLLIASLLMPAWQFIRTSGVNAPQAWFGVEMTMMPKDNKSTFNIKIDMPANAPVEQTDALAREIGAVLRQHQQVRDYQIWLGQSGITDFNGMVSGTSSKIGPNVAEIRVNFRNKKDRSIKSMAIVSELRPPIMALAKHYLGSTIQLVEDPPGPPVRNTLLAEIYGPDLKKLNTISKQVQQVFHNTRDVVEVSNSEEVDIYRYQIVVDREKAAISGVTSANVAAALRRLVDGENLGRAHIDGELNTVPIRLLIPRRHQINIELLSRVFVINDQGLRIPLSVLVKVEPSKVDHKIQRKNGSRVTYVGGETGHIAPVYAVLDMDKKLNGLPLTGGEHLTTHQMGFSTVEHGKFSDYELYWDGSQRQMLESYRDMGGAMMMSLILIFLILVAYYQSFSLSLVAMMAIPFGLIGVFPGHWLMNAQFSATSMIGVIALAGVVVRNSLLIIDFVKEHISQGKPLREAIINAGVIRLRPISLTALAIVLGSAIMLNDPLFSGLAISLIFGTIVATILTLVVIPVILYLLLRWKMKT